MTEETDGSAIAAAGRTWRGAALEPRRFFAGLPARDSLGPAILYYLVIGIAAEGAQLFWSMVFRATGFDPAGMLGVAEAGAEWSPVIDFLLSPLLLLISLFAAAAVTHLLLRLFGGASHGYNFTVRVFAYAYSPQILAVIPVIGQFIGFVWMVVIAIIGLAAGHRTSTGRAAAAVLIPVAIGLTLVAIAALIAATGSLLVSG